VRDSDAASERNEMIKTEKNTARDERHAARGYRGAGAAALEQVNRTQPATALGLFQREEDLGHNYYG
jgi:hypothetical protein